MQLRCVGRALLPVASVPTVPNTRPNTCSVTMTVDIAARPAPALNLKGNKFKAMHHTCALKPYKLSVCIVRHMQAVQTKSISQFAYLNLFS